MEELRILAKVKLIATDMDGTFLNKMMDYDRQRFENLYAQLNLQNIKFVIASGNQYYQLHSFFADHPELVCIAENGAYIRNQAEVFQATSFSNYSKNEILARLTGIENIQVLLSGMRSAYYLTSAAPTFVKLSHQYYPRLVAVDNFESVSDQIMKFSLNCPPAETEQLVEQLRERLHGIAEPTSSGHGGIDIIQPGMNKAAGLQHLGKQWGISLAEMCAFGDGGNDLEMLSAVGEGVAMANAAPVVKQTAPCQTVSNEEQGVLSYIEQILRRR